MSLSNTEFAALLNDDSKEIPGDIEWRNDEDHSPCVIFRTEVRNAVGYPLFVAGNHNPLIPRTSYHLILRTVGRVYGLDHGKEHRNPDGTLAGEKHKHSWEEATADKNTYAPPDITGAPDAPLVIWAQFCQEAKITHNGQMRPLPPLELDLLP